MKKYIILLVVLASNLGFSQTINDYKYAIVPSKFSFLKEKDQYRLNTLTKLLMEKYGFVTFFDTDILTDEVAGDNCKKIFVDVESNGNMFMTKLSVVLKDCKNTILFTSLVGKSREKEYQMGYNQALREAFTSFEKLAKKEKAEENFAPVKFVYSTPTKSNNDTTFFAQPIENGFQIIDTTPKVVMKIYKTSNPSCFIAYKDNNQGVLVNRDNQWFFEYYFNSKVVSEKIEIKF
ncbi:MAG: hypothetical protein EXR18_05915 [Flavobacteriaceae bacterium]|nr:hypothetical protein [Flavobacteriaceae bacterium]